MENNLQAGATQPPTTAYIPYPYEWNRYSKILFLKLDILCYHTTCINIAEPGKLILRRADSYQLLVQ
jgi:hypothetical protein